MLYLLYKLFYSMKKFVGYVNGVSFDNEKDFNEAAEKAIKENDGIVSISSYYSYVNDEQHDVLFDADFMLGDKTPDVVLSDSFEYTISDELKKKLGNASNKSFIRKKVNEVLDSYEYSLIPVYEEKSNELQKEIEQLQERLYADEERLKEAKARVKYYRGVLDIVNDGKKEEKNLKEDKYQKQLPEGKNKESNICKKSDNDKNKFCENKFIANKRLREIFDIDTDLYDFLKQLGL